MAATVEIRSYHTDTPGAGTAVAAVRFKKADNDTANTSNRMPIPPSGTEYSYVKHLALHATTSPDSLIDTCQAYGDGALPTGVQMYMADAAYVDPTTQEDTALGSWANNYTSFTSGSPLSIAGSLSNPSTGKSFTNYLQMQMGVTDAASAGVMTAETLTFSWLES